METVSFWAESPKSHADQVHRDEVLDYIRTFVPSRMLDIPENTLIGGSVAMLMHALDQMGVNYYCYSDQWTKVIAEKDGFRTEVQGDTYLLSFAETYKFWAERLGETE